MIDETAGVITSDGGRKKLEQEHCAIDRARTNDLGRSRAERGSGAALSSVSEFIFTNQAGKPFTKGQYNTQVERTIRLTGIRKFVSHNYRNTALTHWSRQGINVDIAMLASGHSSVQMHKRYVDLQQQDIAKHLERSVAKMATQRDTRKRKIPVSS